jgi:hypothetical protein
MSTQNVNDQECCPPFDPSKWDNKMVEWYNKPFIKDKVFTIMYMPVGFGKVMRRLDSLVRGANATMPDWLCLSDHTSSWNMDVYLAVDKEIPNAQNVTLKGNYYCRVYEGPFQNTGKWTKDYETEAKKNGHNVKKMFMWYTTCPKCAKKYGKNYVVIIGEV